MNNARNSELLERGFLHVNKVSEQNDRVTLRGYMFDNTPFDFTIPSHQYEPQSEGSAGLVPISIVAHSAIYSEVMLPGPALNYGYTVRVKPTSIINWELYNLNKGAK